jgi:predicted small lipoprotein YifL
MSITVNAVHRRVQYTGNGSNLGPFSFSFKVLAAGDIKVSEGTTTKTVTTHYTTSLNADGTGTVTFTSGNAPANNAIVTIESDQAIERTTDYSTGGDFTAASINDALDRLTINDQQIETLLSRNVQLPATVNRTTSGTGTSGPLFFPYADTASDQANKLIAYDSNGTALETTTGRVNSASATASSVSPGGSPTASVTFTASTGALAFALGIPTGATGATGAAGADGVFSEIADQSEAEAGTNNTKGMTPLRVKQAVDSYGLLAANDLSDLANAATARTNLGLAIGTDVQAFDADNLTADVSDNLTAGFSSDFEAIGNSGTGTQTLEISSTKENLKTITINGSFTLAPQTVNSVIALIATNDGTGGYTITTSGYDLVSGTYNNAASAKHLFRSTVIDGTQVLEILEIA